MGIMEKKMETTIMGHTGFRDRLNQYQHHLEVC